MSPAQKLVSRFLDRENATTRLIYQQALQDPMAGTRDKKGKLVSGRGLPGRSAGISPTAVYDLVVALGKKTGIRKVRGKNKVPPHARRHPVFTEAGREVNRTGRGVETLMKFTRHNDARVAQGYLDAADDAAASIAAAVASELD